jgi:hypothetical protein
MMQCNSDYGQDTSQCDPLETDPLTGKTLFPCGLIAQSKFNGTHVLSSYNIPPPSIYEWRH